MRLATRLGRRGSNSTWGATRYFIVNLVLVNDPQPLREYVDRMRSRLGLAPMEEFSFNKSSNRHRHAFLSGLSDLDFVSRAIVVDKTLLPDDFRHMRSVEFYAFFVAQLLNHLPAGELDRTILHLDCFGAPKTALRCIRQQLAHLQPKDRRGLLKRIAFKQSHRENGIQVADMIAGAIFRWREKHDVRFATHIWDKIWLWEYRTANPPT
jgi:hypothetical protein